MRNLWDRIKESFCGILPFFLLFGIPAILACFIWILTNWNEVHRVIDFIYALGNGSLAFGVILLLFGILGFVNAFAAVMLWLKHFLKWLNKGSKSRVWFWFLVIVATLGWAALFKIISQLANL